MAGRRKNGESGFAMLLVFVLAAAIAISLYVEVPRIAFEKQRDREQLLVDRGGQYQRAIQLFYRKFGRYPASMDDLETTNNIRFLRRKYKDPLTGKDDWRIVHMGPGGFLTDSLVQKPPEQKTDKDKQQNAGNTTGGTQPDGSQTTPEPGSGLNLATVRRPSDRMAGNLPNGQPGAPIDPNAPNADPNQPQNPQQYPVQPGQPGYPQIPGAPGQPVDPNQPQPQPGQPGTPGQPFPFPAGQPGQPGVPGQPGQPYPFPGGQPGQPGVPGQPYPYPVGQPGQPGIPGQPQPYPYPGGQPGQPVDPNNPNPQYGQVQYGQIQPNQNFNPNQPYNPNQPFPVQGRGGFMPPFPGAPQPGGQPFGGGAGQSNPAVNMIQNLLTTPRQPPPGIAGGTSNNPIGAGIAGVASKYEGEGIKLINERKKYKEWEFVYDFKNDRARMGAQGQPNVGPQVPGVITPGGGTPTPPPAPVGNR